MDKPTIDTNTYPGTEPEPELSFRKFFSLVNLLRILHKITKGQHHRTQILLKYQAEVLSDWAIPVGVLICPIRLGDH